jgi:hypothetical protein
MFRRSIVLPIASRSAILAGICAFLFVALSAGSATADPAFPPGMRIGLQVPPGMMVSRHFPGFEDVDRKVAIALLELPVPAYDHVEQSIFSKAPPGLIVEKREMFPFSDGIGFLLTGRTEADGVIVHKWFLLGRAVGGPNTDLTAFVNMDVPEEARGIYTDKVVRAALASVAFRPPPLAEQVAMLPFTLGDLAGFRVMQAMPEGGVIITDGPSNDITGQPYMIVSVGRSASTEPNDRGTVARDLLSSAPLRELTPTSSEAMRIGGLPGYEIRATAKNLRGDSVKLVQWVRFGAGGYMRIVGVMGADRWDELFNRFRAVRDGIALR